MIKGVDDLSTGAYEGSFSDIYQTHEFIFSSEYIQEHTRSCIAIDDVKHEQLAPLAFLDGLKTVESEPKQSVINYEEQPLNDDQQIDKDSLHDFYDPFGKLLQSSKQVKIVMLMGHEEASRGKIELPFSGFFLTRGAECKLQFRSHLLD